MSLYKQKTSRLWWMQIWTSDGKRVRKSTGTEDRAQAEIIEKALAMAYGKKTPAENLHAMIDAVYGRPAEGLPLTAVWETYTGWLATTGKAVTEVTLRKRKNAIARLTAWTVSKWPAATTAQTIDRKTALAFAAMMAKKGTKGKTRRNVLGDLSTIWEALRRTTDGLANPWPLVRPEARDSERGQPFTRDEEKAVMAAAADAGNGWPLACLIARHTGLRYSSIARLQWNEVDLENGVIRHTPPKTKRNDIRVVIPMTKPLMEEMKRAWEAREKQNARKAARPNAIIRPLDAEFILPLHAAYYPRPEMAGGPGAFAEILESAKIKGRTFHSWRHTFRTRLSEAGVSDDTAKRLGGWTEDATAARYDHAERITEMREAVEKAATENPTPSPAQ